MDAPEILGADSADALQHGVYGPTKPISIFVLPA
jgi:hypothetical protein